MESINFEYRAMIKFLLKDGCNVTAMHQCLVAVYGDVAPNCCTVTRWLNEFTRGHQSLQDDFRCGWLSDAVNLILITVTERLIIAN